jgi:TolB protein
MSQNLFRTILLFAAMAVILSACGASIPTSVPATATEEPTAVAAVSPFTHTTCAGGVDLTGKTVSFYNVLNPDDQVDTVYAPLRAGYADATEYFNVHGGICGATIEQVFDETHWGDAASVYSLFAALKPKPVVVTIYGSGDGVQLAPQLATDQIPALNIRGGSTASAYGEDGQTPGWVFATRPLYPDQVGAMCDYIVAHPERFPHPVLGFINFDDAWPRAATEEARPYCTSLGIGDAGVSYFSGGDTYIQPHVQNLVDAGANILYTHSHENGPALVAKTLVDMGLKGKVTLAAVNTAMDPYVAFSSEANLDADGIPAIDGMLGSMPTRSLAETDNAGIRLITEQADLHQRPLTMRTDGYIMGWDTTDLLIEVYIQTGNRVGFDHITGADIKETLENIVYAPLSGVERIDYRGGTRRALAEDRIGEMNFLGQDGKTPASANNPPMLVQVGDQKHMVPMILPVSDFQAAPDLRPGGANALAPTVEPADTQVVLGVVPGRIAFQTNRDGNNEIYVMNGDGTGLTNLTNNPADDVVPTWSPDGKKIAFSSNRDGNNEIYVMNTDGSRLTRLTDTSGDDFGPAWSPDGKKIAFLSNRDGNDEIYVMNADGSAQINLSNDPAGQGTPTWSPDGTEISFDAGHDDVYDIYKMSADGSGVSRVMNYPGPDFWPAWSSVGSQIAFTTGRDGKLDIYVMNTDGTDQMNLTNDPSDDSGPRWSPEGKQIIFWSNRDGNNELYAMDTDGSNPVRLTNNPADDTWPSWSP